MTEKSTELTIPFGSPTMERKRTDMKHVPPSGQETSEQTLIVPPKPLPWYQKILQKLHITKDVGIYIAIFVFLVSGFFISQATLKQKSLRVKAGTNTVKISIQPATSTMPPNTTYQLWATADNPVAFATVKIVFDPAKVKMIGEISTSPSPLTRVVKQTAMSEANTTGIINLSLALDPTKKSTPPTGTFELATIPMGVNTTTQNISTTLHLDSSVMQVVNPDATLFTITAVDSVIALNPPATPTPTPTTKPTPTPTPTKAPTPTPTLKSTSVTISNIATTGVTTTQATVTWTTSVATIGWISYGTSANSLTQQTQKDVTPVTSHQTTINGLAAGQWVYYQVNAQDASGKIITSSSRKFKTSTK